MKQDKRTFYGGTSGLVLPVPNKSMFPPEFQHKSRLTYYASLFNSIEINSSFYKLPMAVTVKKWAESVPDGFQFTFKISQSISHAPGLDFSNGDVAKFMHVVAPVESKKGCILIQLPPSLKDADRQLRKLIKEIQRHDPSSQWKLCVEFRNKSWYNTDTYALLNDYKTTLVIHDMHASGTPEVNVTTSFVYLRFHGPERGYKGSYTNDFLLACARRIKDWEEEGKIVYVYFNNTIGDAVKNLMALKHYV